MFREHTGYMEINVSHELSRRVSIKNNDKFINHDIDQNFTSKVEMRFVNVRGVQ